MHNGKKTLLSIAFCLPLLALQAQEVKTVTLDTIPKAPLPEATLSSGSVRPTLGGFPVLSGSTYYAEPKEGTSLKINPNAIPHYETPHLTWGPVVTFRSSEEVPGMTGMQTAGFAYQQNIGRLTLMPYAGMSQINTGVYGFGNITKANLGGMMSYQVNDWLRVGLYGQFVPTKTSDPRSIIVSPFIPKSNYGGFVEVMFNEHWGVGAKVGREFAPSRNGKWEWKNTTEVYPIYKK